MKNYKLNCINDYLMQESLFRDTLIRCDTLKSFLNANVHHILKMIDMLNTKYSIGIEIAKLIDAAACGSEEIDFDNVIEQISNLSDDRIRVGDIMEFSYESSTQLFSYTRKRYNGIDNATYKRYDPNTAREKLGAIGKYSDMLVSSYLSNVVMIFEDFLAGIYTCILYNNPEPYMYDKKIDLKSIIEAENYQTLITSAINAEVEAKLYNSIDLLDLINKKQGVSFDSYRIIYDQFIEIYYRRNIFIHNKGYVNETYLSHIPAKLQKEAKLDVKFKFDPNYLSEASDILIKMIGAIYFEHVVASAIKADNDSILDNYISDHSFKFLCDSEYSIASSFYKPVITKAKHHIDRTIAKLNHLICLKQSGTNISGELELFDTTTMQPRFCIAKAALADNNEEVYKLLTATYPSSYLAENIENWPIFIDFRKTEWYEKFRQEHLEDFQGHLFKSVNIDESCVESPEQ